MRRLLYNEKRLGFLYYISYHSKIKTFHPPTMIGIKSRQPKILSPSRLSSPLPLQHPIQTKQLAPTKAHTKKLENQSKLAKTWPFHLNHPGQWSGGGDRWNSTIKQNKQSSSCDLATTKDLLILLASLFLSL